jgi:hypothetical protein
MMSRSCGSTTSTLKCLFMLLPAALVVLMGCSNLQTTAGERLPRNSKPLVESEGLVSRDMLSQCEVGTGDRDKSYCRDHLIYVILATIDTRWLAFESGLKSDSPGCDSLNALLRIGMETARRNALTRILTRLRESATDYPLAAALIDLVRYRDAGTIPAGISSLLEAIGSDRRRSVDRFEVVASTSLRTTAASNNLKLDGSLDFPRANSVDDSNNSVDRHIVDSMDLMVLVSHCLGVAPPPARTAPMEGGGGGGAPVPGAGVPEIPKNPVSSVLIKCQTGAGFCVFSAPFRVPIGTECHCRREGGYTT